MEIKCEICGEIRIIKYHSNKKCRKCSTVKQNRLKRMQNNNVFEPKRNCPICNKEIFYSSIKSALQANENNTLCKTCTNIKRHQIPGYTQKTMQNCMKYCHTTKGVSKLEKQLIPFLEKFQFKHFMLFGRPPTNEFNGLCPDFINREQKIIIELFGDYWHANPQRFKPQDYIKQLKLTAEQTWFKDKERLQKFHTFGYKTIILWERDVRKHIKLNTIDKFIQQCLLHNDTKSCTNDDIHCG